MINVVEKKKKVLQHKSISIKICNFFLIDLGNILLVKVIIKNIIGSFDHMFGIFLSLSLK